jgi:hypothetical protein
MKTEKDCIAFNAKHHQWYFADSIDNVVKYVVENVDSARHYCTMTELLYTTLPSFYLLDHRDQRALIIIASTNDALCNILNRNSPYQFHSKPWVERIGK